MVKRSLPRPQLRWGNMAWEQATSRCWVVQRHTGQTKRDHRKLVLGYLPLGRMLISVGGCWYICPQHFGGIPEGEACVFSSQGLKQSSPLLWVQHDQHETDAHRHMVFCCINVYKDKLYYKLTYFLWHWCIVLIGQHQINPGQHFRIN